MKTSISKFHLKPTCAALVDAIAALRKVRPPPDMQTKLREALDQAMREGLKPLAALWIGIAVSIGSQLA